MFEDATLDFGDGGGLHVIYGANEAGKTTALAAMSDLLFGIDERTPFNFRFEYGKLRIGAKLVKSNGERIEFKRRKARAGTLVSLSQPETTFPDAIITPFLGGIDRDQFHLMFGLDQNRLRIGGRRMLDPHGNFAHALFAAGTGLESVNAVLTELEEEIKRLGSLVDRRSKGEIWSAIERFTSAISVKRSDMIVPENYLATEKARDDAAANRIEVDEQLKGLRARRNFLERGRRVAPILTSLRTLRRDAAQYDDVPDLPENFFEIWKKVDDDARSASQAVDRNAAEGNERKQELEGLPAIDPIVGFEAAIDALSERLGKYLGDEDDVPKLARRIAEMNDQIQALMRDLGLDDDPADIESVIPNKITFAKICELIRNGAVIRAASDSARTGHEEAKAALANAEAGLVHLPPDVNVSEPSELLARAAKLGDVTNALAVAKSEADAAVWRSPRRWDVLDYGLARSTNSRPCQFPTRWRSHGAKTAVPLRNKRLMISTRRSKRSSERPMRSKPISQVSRLLAKSRRRERFGTRATSVRAIGANLFAIDPTGRNCQRTGDSSVTA